MAAEFVAPRLRGQRVGVRIGGLACSMTITPNSYQGWGRFRPVDFRKAKYVAGASEDERERYLKLLPVARMLVAGRDDDGFLGVPAYYDNRFELSGPTRLHFADGLELFDCVVARFDGQQFLYDDRDNGRSPEYAENLRNHLAESHPATQIEVPGLLPEERWLYCELIEQMKEAARRMREAAEQERRANSEYRIADALAHAGAVMRSYIERNDGYMVEFAIDGRRHTSFVDKNLRVQSAGLCLSGRDHDYDLASLVSVIREGEERGGINRTRVNPDRHGEANEYRYDFNWDEDNDE